jgi:putative transcriptional regulator
MPELKGSILKATSSLDGTYFEGASIFITEHNAKGAAGFVLNKFFPRKLNELVEFSHAAAIDIYEGGPVDNEHLYFIHKDPSLGGEQVKDGIYFGGDFQKAVKLLTEGQLASNEVKIFLGYCGWNSGELEAEIEEDSWELQDDLYSLFYNK